MNNSVNPAMEDRPRKLAQPTPDEIRTQLRTILYSHSFQGSKRCQQFLEYACEKALDGDAGALKERAIAVNIFGRRPETALGEDTIVRVGAREVRKRLAQFYVSPDGVAAAVHIDLPSGSYVPDFSYPAELRNAPRKEEHPDEIASEVPAVPALYSSRIRAHGRVLLWCGIAAACAVVVLVFALRGDLRNPNAVAFRQFWDPVLRSPDPLLIGVGHPIVYQPSRRIAALNEQLLGPPSYASQRPIQLPPNQVNGSDMVPVLNQFVGFGDMVAANEITRMLASHGGKTRLALASSFSFSDLRGMNAYLIGSLTNRWTMELSQNWPFQFGWSRHLDAAIRDTTSPTPRQWTVASNGDGSTPDDYSMICRVRDSPTGALLVVAAGLKQFGTEAAGRIVADPDQFGAILARLPKGWQNRNLEIVIHVRVIGNSPARPDLVASRVW